MITEEQPYFWLCGLPAASFCTCTHHFHHRLSPGLPSLASVYRQLCSPVCRNNNNVQNAIHWHVLHFEAMSVHFNNDTIPFKDNEVIYFLFSLGNKMQKVTCKSCEAQTLFKDLHMAHCNLFSNENEKIVLFSLHMYIVFILDNKIIPKSFKFFIVTFVSLNLFVSKLDQLSHDPLVFSILYNCNFLFPQCKYQLEQYFHS